MQKLKTFLLPFLFLSLILSLVTPALCAEYEWITNGTFETGSLSGWTFTSNVYATSSQARNGTYSCQIGDSPSGGDKYIFQNTTGTPVINSIISFGLWVRGTANETWVDGVNVIFADGLGGEALLEMEPVLVEDTWQYITIINDTYSEISKVLYGNYYITQITLTKANGREPVYVDTISLILPYDSDGGQGGSGYSSIDAFINALVQVSVPAIVILFCALLCYKYAGALGFIAGLNVGILLCVIFLGFPQYALVVIVIVDILIFFGSAKL